MKPILVVEDDDSLRNLIRLALDSDRFPVHTARDGFEALEYLRDHECDMMLLDWHLPHISGEALLLTMGIFLQQRTMHVVALTASNAISFPPDHPFAPAIVLRKPFDIVDIPQALGLDVARNSTQQVE